MSLIKSLGAGRKSPGVIFFHVPKTGGTSVSNALRQYHRLSQFHIKSRASATAAVPDIDSRPGEPGLYEDVQELRINLILYWAHAGKRFLTGHVWNDRRIVDLKELGYLLVTCLRHPVDRWFSAYFYDRYKTDDHARIDQDIDEFLLTERARSMGSTYVRYLGGVREDRDYVSPSAIADAREMMGTLDIIGFLEDLDQLGARVRGRMGITLTFPHRRRSPVDRSDQDRIKGSKLYRGAVEKLCQPDLELYEHARLLFQG